MINFKKITLLLYWSEFFLQVWQYFYLTKVEHEREALGSITVT